MKIDATIRRNPRKSITITGVWLAIEEAPEPIILGTRAINMREGDSLELTISQESFRKFIRKAGTLDCQ